MAMRSGRTGPMDERELTSILSREIKIAVGDISADGGSDISNQRRKSLDYYFGEPFGNEVEGRSQVVLSEVRDTVEWMMPALMEMFTASSEAVRYEPEGEEDEAFTEQATDYANLVFYRDNPGFMVLYEFLKDALLEKNGIAKIVWDDTPKDEVRRVIGASIEEITLILAEHDSEVLEHTARIQDDMMAKLRLMPEGDSLKEQFGVDANGNVKAWEQAEEALQSLGLSLEHDVKFKFTNPGGRIAIESIAPEEFLISRRAKPLSVEIPPFCAHRREMTASELVQMGIPREVVDSIPSSDEQEYNQERLARFNTEDQWPIGTSATDSAMREIWVYECYMQVDFDGDGVTELRKILVAGSESFEILENEEVEDIPFCGVTPIPIPHRYFGLSVADLVMDLQEIKSTVFRQWLDNMYSVNNARHVIRKGVNLSDYMTNRVGQAVRYDGDGSAADAIYPLTTQPLVGYVAPLLEALDEIEERRTGVSRYQQGLDPDSLNEGAKTARGMSIMISQGAKKLALIARIMAETGVRDIFKKMLKLIVSHQDRPRTVRLRGEWVTVDPRAWNAEMDARVMVGLGYGDKSETLAGLQLMLGLTEKIVAMQGGADGPLIDLKNIYETVKETIEATGMRHPGKFISDPSKKPPPQPKQPEPDPKIVVEQIRDKRERDEMQLEHQRAMTKMQQDFALASAKMLAEHDVKSAKNMLEAAKLEEISAASGDLPTAPGVPGGGNGTTHLPDA